MGRTFRYTMVKLTTSGVDIMTGIVIRQSGGANIVSIPKAIVQMLGLQVGSKLDLSIRGDYSSP